MNNIAAITGVTGQDGSYLAEFLIKKGYTVHGLIRSTNSLNHENISHLIKDHYIYQKKFFTHIISFNDIEHLRKIISKINPDEFYHLASQSNPSLSFHLPETTIKSINIITIRLLEIIKSLPKPPKFLNASSSEIFGNALESPQNENTAMKPVTPYGAAKVFSQQIVSIYRTTYRLPACSAILYNHESVRRSPHFLTMKVAKAVARIKTGLQNNLILGDINQYRDWGWAPDYVKGMWKMLQIENIDDFILATGKTYSVKDFVKHAFSFLDLNWKKYVKYENCKKIKIFIACGNPEKAKKNLGWENTVSFKKIIEQIVISEYNKINKYLN